MQTLRGAAAALPQTAGAADERAPPSSLPIDPRLIFRRCRGYRLRLPVACLTDRYLLGFMDRLDRPVARRAPVQTEGLV